ncbi:hypothetical protein NC651_010924 [Populus alba x Populus x berolinensis]|nr:hypothetical protein NC651_010924 [Populus alba x Populus x berolinensis]
MAGLLAWAADVVGAHGNNHELSEDRIPIVFTEDQQKYVQELDSKASSLSRSIQGLRLRLPSPDISQRLPHILAHSLASNAALALQLNAHSATKEQGYTGSVLPLSDVEIEIHDEKLFGISEVGGGINLHAQRHSVISSTCKFFWVGVKGLLLL